MRVSLDENVSERLVPPLRMLGHHPAATTEQGLKGATDPQQLMAATRLGRVFVTHNGRDFRMLHEALTLWAARWGLRDAVLHAGILIIVPKKGMTVAAMAQIIDELANREADLASRLFVWNEREGLIEPE